MSDTAPVVYCQHCHEQEYKVLYECLYCGSQHKSPKEAVECYAKHCKCRSVVGTESPNEVENELCEALEQVATVFLCGFMLYVLLRL